MSKCTVISLAIHPIKGCRAIQCEELTLRADGIEGDRELMLIADGHKVSQHDLPTLAKVEVSLLANGVLGIEHPEAGSIEHTIVKSGAEQQADLYGNGIATTDQGDAAASFFQQATGTNVRLVSLPKAWDRQIPLPQFGELHGHSQGAFYDVAPVLLANQASLDDLNQRATATVPMERFRANVVVQGLEPYAEDELTSVATDAVLLRNVVGCERCAVTTTDQRTGERPTQEPLRTLSQYRRAENKYASGVLFGAYMAVGRAGILRRGDVLHVER